MNRPYYDFNAENFESVYFYRFLSIGASGAIIKMVFFQEIEPNLFNLVLTDYNATTQEPDDMSITNNQDMPKFFATIFQIVNNFSLKCLKLLYLSQVIRL